MFNGKEGKKKQSERRLVFGLEGKTSLFGQTKQSLQLKLMASITLVLVLNNLILVAISLGTFKSWKGMLSLVAVLDEMNFRYFRFWIH